jgi:membrane protein YdbS with pleckstrin-like domain
MDFTNEQINTDNLPSFTDSKPEKLDYNYLNVMYLSRGIASLIFITIVTGAALYIPFPVSKPALIIVVSIIILWFCIYFLITKPSFDIKSYSLRRRDIMFTSGLIFRSFTIVPYNRIQHIEVTMGPIERTFGLASVKIFTAGGSQSDLAIPGLTVFNANRIRSFIVSQISADEEE